MPSIVWFIAGRLLSKSFWLLVVSTFLGVLLLAARSYYRSEIFSAAIKESQPWRFNGNRF